MAKQVVWTKIAQGNRTAILQYWIYRNKSDTYSKKLNGYFKESVELISKYPRIGKKTEYPDIRIKVVKNYLLTYRIKANRIEILTIWDSRQDPDDFLRIIKKR
jgi:plasmid stabilization system protein ParE